LKYELLQQEGFEVLQDARNFTVVLPLIWNNPNDKHFSFIQKDSSKKNLINNHKL
jgi:two-component system LytT family sensor kinase